jgi:SAM-dependent methyltransferase
LDLNPAPAADVTCGPGLYGVELARRGCAVTGVDFSPAAIAYAKDLVRTEGLATACTFIEQDVRDINFTGGDFDTVLFLYGQLAVFTKAEAQMLLCKTAQALARKPMRRLLNQSGSPKPVRVVFTDDSAWGDRPFCTWVNVLYEEEECRWNILHCPESGS